MKKPLLYDRWDLSEVEVEDRSLVSHIGLKPVVVPRTCGRHTTQSLHKSKMSIVERFINKLMVPGHRGRRHKITSGKCSGRTATITLEMEKALEKIEKKMKKNPVQVLVRAVENAALLEEVASYRLGGIIARKAVITSPQRRIDLALRHLAQGTYSTSFQKNITLAEAIAEEIISAFKKDSKCYAIQERNRMEREAEGAR